MQIVSVRRNLFTVPSNQELHVSSSQPRHWIQVIVYTQSTMGSDLSQPTSTSLALPLASFLLLKSFYVLCLCFSTANMQSISTSEPNLFGGFHTLVCQSICTCASIRELFPQRYSQSGPPTLCVGMFCLYVMFQQCLFEFV